MSKKDLLSTYLRRGTALVLAASIAGIAGIAQAGPTKGGTLTVGLETDVRGFDTVKGGVYGAHPSLTDLATGNLKVTTAFRRVYATMIKEWLGFDDTETILNGDYETFKAFA